MYMYMYMYSVTHVIILYMHVYSEYSNDLCATSSGCNDGENFPESFLLEIYDRIQSVSLLNGRNCQSAIVVLH